MSRRVTWFIGAMCAAVVAAGAVFSLVRSDVPEFHEPALTITSSGLSQPSDIVRFNGRYVATELYKNRLAVFDDLELNGLRHFDPKDIGQRFESPHFLAVTPWDTLLISNGWGDSIVEIADLDGRGWKEFSGLGEGFHAPHGICVDQEGWIYVGDSLNSRLVRFRDMDGTDWQVFEDHDKQVSYIRELVCRNGTVWISNSYEGRPGLNPGRGGNLLTVTDFESGRTEVVASFPDSNVTGVLPLDDRTLLIGKWGGRRRLALADLSAHSTRELPRLGLGTPYGTYRDSENRQVLVTYLGKLFAEEREQIGGIAVYR